MFEYFYNKSLRKVVVGFGSLFNNIHVEHVNPDNANSATRIKVPITYAPQEKFIRRYLEPSSITDTTRLENQLPRLSYMMNSIVPDPSRRRNKSNHLKNMGGSAGNCSNPASVVEQEVPVNITFSLFIYTRHIDDTLQIVEQIIPYFNPDHIISIDLNSAMPNTRIPITMLNNNISERFDGDFGNRRVNISSFNFLAKSYIFGKIENYTTITNSTIETDFDLDYSIDTDAS
jgi:hypothetical protein